MDDDDLTLQKQLRELIRSTRTSMKEFLDNVLEVIQNYRQQKLISREEQEHVLYRYRHFLAMMSVIELAFIANPPLMTSWCADQLTYLSEELEKYIDELECFNDTEVFRRMEIQYPFLKTSWKPPK